MSAVIMRVSWNSNYDVLLRACLWCAVMLAVVLVTPLIVAAVTPVVVGCCSAVVASVPEIVLAAALLAALWKVKP
jgi:hypothetical protein